MMQYPAGGAFQTVIVGVVMLDREPLIFPFRRPERYPYSPGIPDRQLWALGMIVVQWGMTEMLLDQQTRQLIGDDTDLQQQYEGLRNARQLISFKGKQRSRCKTRSDPRHKRWSSGYRISTPNVMRLFIACGVAACRLVRGQQNLTKRLMHHCFVKQETSSRPNQLMHAPRFIGGSRSKD
jgi:hypothetical protein